MDSEFKEYSGRDVAVLLNSFVRLKYHETPLFAAASVHLRNLAETEFISERDLGLIFNAFARAGIADSALFDKLGERVNKQLSELSTQSCGNIAHAFGKLGMKNEMAAGLLPQIAVRVCSPLLAKKVSCQELSNILYSFGNLGLADSEFLEPLINLVKKKINRFNSIEIAAVATALAKLDISDKLLMVSMKNVVEKNDKDYNPYEITAVLHAYSQLQVSVPTKLFLEIAPVVFSSGEFNSHTACIALGAFARASITPPVSLLERLAPAIQSENNPQYLVDTVFAISRIGFVHECLEHILIFQVEKLAVKSFPICAANLNQLIYALNKLEIITHISVLPFYEHIVAKAILEAKEFNGRQISNILFILSRRNISCLSEIEKKLITFLFKQLIAVTEKEDGRVSSQLFGSCIDSAARLGGIETSVWTQLEGRLKMLAPDSSVDVGIIEALTRAGRLNGEIAEIILKRIDCNKLSLSHIMLLLQTIGLARGASLAILRGVKLSAGKAALRSFDRMTSEDLLILANNLNDAAVIGEVFPLNLIDIGTISKNGSAVNEISYAINDTVQSFPGNKIDFIVEQIENCHKHSVTQSVRDIFIDQLIANLETSSDIGLVARSIPFLSPQHDKFLARKVIEILSENKVQSNMLALGACLLSIQDRDLRKQLVSNYLPTWLKSGTNEEIASVVSSLVK